MRVLFLSLLLLVAGFAQADDVNRKICLKGFERLVVLSNAEKVTDEEFEESVIIADSLLRNQCYQYAVDRWGRIYAGASLPYLFGKICDIRHDKDAVMRYVYLYQHNKDSVLTDEMDNALESLFHSMTDVFFADVLNNENNKHLLPGIAWGFLNNVYAQHGGLKKTNYREVFYKRYPAIKNVDGERKEVVESIFREIENIVE